MARYSRLLVRDGVQCDLEDRVVLWAGSLPSELLVMSFIDHQATPEDLVIYLINRMLRDKQKNYILEHLPDCEHCRLLAIDALKQRRRHIWCLSSGDLNAVALSQIDPPIHLEE